MQGAGRTTAFSRCPPRVFVPFVQTMTNYEKIDTTYEKMLPWKK